MSDAQQLLQVFSATIHHDPQVRGQAEAQLEKLKTVPGSLTLVLQLIASPEVEMSARQAASIFFKNRVQRGWKPSDTARHPEIDAQDKEEIKKQMLSALVATPSNIGVQLVACLSVILENEYPANWPQLLPMLQEMLQSNEQKVVHSGLLALREAVKVYQWRAKERREPLNNIIRVAFPLLVNIAQQLLAHDDLEAGEMVKIACKTYFSSSLHELSDEQQEVGSLTTWLTLFLAVVEKDIPVSTLPEDLDEREKHSWWKAKKWAMHCVNRLFARYGNPALLARSNTRYTQFADAFIGEIMPNVLRAYLGQVDKAISTGAWMSQRCIALTCHLLSDRQVSWASTWAIVKPHTDALVARFIFPQLCISAADEELWQDDPVDYINKKADPLEDLRSPTTAATNLLLDLVRDRKKLTFLPILNFVNTTLMTYQQAAPEARNYREKDGALCMMGCLADHMLGKKSPVRAQMEEFVMVHIYPEFRSQVPYLRSRESTTINFCACDTMSKFDGLVFSNEQHPALILEATLACMKDPELPVRAAAAISMQPLAHALMPNTTVRPMMVPHLPTIMQELLSLTNQIDVDALSGVTDEFVETFGEELAPFAVQICQQLRDTYLRIMNEVIAAESKAEADMLDVKDLEESSDKTMNAMGVLKNISTLVVSLEAKPELQTQLEETIIPVVSFTLQHGAVELYDEVLEIVDCCIYSRKAISPAMWSVFSLIAAAYKAHAVEFTEEFFPTASNFVCYGKDAVVASSEIQQALVDMISLAMTSDKVGEVDRTCACTLMECLMLNCPGALDQYLGHFIDAALHYLLSEDGIKTGPFRIRCLTTVVTALLYNSTATLQLLEARQRTQAFFQIWFENLKKFKGMHDTKLCVMALCALLEKSDGQLPASVSASISHLLNGLISLLPTYEKAAADQTHLEALRASLDSDEDEDEDEDAEGVEDVENEDKEYLEFLASRDDGASDQGEADGGDGDDDFYDDDDEGANEGMFESPLDDADLHTQVEHTLKSK
ncbi:armadillo-type protein [Thamnocephalis sphaerospora]|uniref:Armadillo-type protein n=1 Tax=Thamnocephalis sphaerospora TaxID=78915 RepID=A0A4P9XWS8_9FUNG|nr:armadillo-type protein [Thamnocephalis sphaerospora]|eukprot:RKP10883.1 armadillo-type protein [Thamnocephalis sphaerospora]